jgi:DnaJ-class molecular chaperone
MSESEHAAHVAAGENRWFTCEDCDDEEEPTVTDPADCPACGGEGFVLEESHDIGDDGKWHYVAWRVGCDTCADARKEYAD